MLGDGGGNKYGTTKVFATEKLSDRDIIDYAQSLTGGAPFKEVTTPLGTVYFSKKDGVTISLRDYSASEEKTNARWTIEILGNKDLQALQGKVKKKVEIKFR